MHCELAISAPAPGGKTCSLSGRVTLTVRFKAATDGASSAGSAKAAEMPTVASRININTFGLFMFRSSGSHQRDGFDNVAHEARSVPVCGIRLRDSCSIRRLEFQLHGTGLRYEVRFPLP